MSRYKTRENLMKSFYMMEFNEDIDDIYILGSEDIKALPENELKYTMNVVTNFFENKDKIDSLINSCSRKWKMDRLPKVDLAILRLAATEILFMSDEIPHQISINEAVNLSKKYSDEESYSLVNGILGAIIKEK